MWSAYVTCMQKYIDFSGRATRSEYWWFFLANFLIAFVLGVLRLDTIASVYQLAVFIPGLAVFWRRMHDINRSGLNFFWIFLPLVGWIIVLVFLCTPTKK